MKAAYLRKWMGRKADSGTLFQTEAKALERVWQKGRRE